MFFFTLQVEGGVNQPTWDWLPWWKIWKPQVDYGSLQKEIENQLRIAKLQVQSADCHSCWGKYVFWVISRFGFHKISTRFKYIQIWDWKNNLNHIPCLVQMPKSFFPMELYDILVQWIHVSVQTYFIEVRMCYMICDMYIILYVWKVPKIYATGIKYAFPTPMEYALWTPQP